MIREIRNDLIHFLSDKYITEDNRTIAGDNYFNSALPDTSQKINMFSIGISKTLPQNYMLVQGRSLNASRDTLPNIGSIDWGVQVALNVYIEINTNPTNASLLGDLYSDILFNAFQVFIYNYQRYTPVNPRLSINKYFDTGKSDISDFNAIKKLIVSGDLIFTTKTSELTLEN